MSSPQHLDTKRQKEINLIINKIIMKKLKTFRKYLMNFQQIAKSIRGNYGMDSPTDRVRREIEDLRVSIESLTGSMRALGEHFGVELIETKVTGGYPLRGSTDDSDTKKNN